MSIYTKKITDINTDDLDLLLSENSVENLRLEFKREDPSKNELLKKLSSFANTHGGWLVVGAEASSSDGKLNALNGIDEIPGYKQKVIQWCFDGITPTINVEVSDPIPTSNDLNKYCYVIYVEEGDLAPYFLNGRKGIYIRTDEFSQLYEPKLATLEEILLLNKRREPIQQRRTLLVNRAKNRFERFEKFKLC